MSFIERISFERKVLKAINKSFKAFQLNGLTNVALKQWKQTSNVDDVLFEDLCSLSRELKSINQRSGEIFSIDYQETSLKCSTLFEEIKLKLSGDSDL